MPKNPENCLVKQAGNVWHEKLHSVLVSMGFKRAIVEHSIWIYQRDGVRIIIPVFVDDMTIAAKSKEAIEHVKDQLRQHFKLRDLGVEIKRDRSNLTLSLNQHQYILDILARFNMSDCNPVTTPMLAGQHLNAEMCPTTDKDKEQMKAIPYLQAVGSLLYLAIATRPDISYTVGVLARYSHNPGPAHWAAVKHLFRYLKGTLDLALVYKPVPNAPLFLTYTDAAHGDDKDTGKSTSGYLVKMGTGAISWSSKLQSIVTLSTTEAEYVAAVSAGQEIVWMRQLLSEMGYSMDKPSKLLIDNQSAISVAKNPEHHGHMKHLDLQYFWLRDEVQKRHIHVEHQRTDEMPADLFTKSLARDKVEKFRAMMGLQDMSDQGGVLE